MSYGPIEFKHKKDFSWTLSLLYITRISYGFCEYYFLLTLWVLSLRILRISCGHNVTISVIYDKDVFRTLWTLCLTRISCGHNQCYIWQGCLSDSVNIMPNKDILWTLSTKHKKDLRMDLRKCLESMRCMSLQRCLVDPLSVMSRMSRGPTECHVTNVSWTHWVSCHECLVDPLSVMSRMSRGLCEDNVSMSCGCSCCS